MSLRKPTGLEWVLIAMFVVFAAGRVYLALRPAKPAGPAIHVSTQNQQPAGQQKR